MTFLYGVKGCSHCDSRDYCPKELKNSDSNLLKRPRAFDQWTSFCADFLRLIDAG